MDLSVLPTHGVMDHLVDLDRHRGQERQEDYPAELGHGEGAHLEEGVEAGEEQHRQQQYHAGGKGAQARPVGGEAQPEDGLDAPAVEPWPAPLRRCRH